MSDSFGFEKIEREQADQDENITSSSMTENVGEEAPEEDMFRDDIPQKGANLLDDSLGGGDVYSNEATPAEPLISFGSPVAEPSAPSLPPQKIEPVADSTPVSTKTAATSGEGLMGIPGMPALCCWMKTVDPRVLDLIYWRDVKKTGVVFGTMLFILLSLTFFTILSVAAYLSLAILTVTLSFRVYKNVMQAVQKTNDGHPFKKLLAVEIALSEDVVQNAAEKIAGNMNNCCKELRRLFLVEDYVDSLKFGLLLWLMTYVGSWFNGMTLVILAVVCIFTLPKVYETYQGPIDQNVNLVRAQLNNIMTQVSSKIPFPKKKAKTQ